MKGTLIQMQKPFLIQELGHQIPKPWPRELQISEMSEMSPYDHNTIPHHRYLNRSLSTLLPERFNYGKVAGAPATVGFPHIYQ